MLDGDTARREAAEAIEERLVRRVHVRIVDLPDGQQPDQLTGDELREI
jgi:DNA primase